MRGTSQPSVRQLLDERTRAWRSFRRHYLPDAELVAASRIDGEQRLYRRRNRAIKVLRHSSVWPRRVPASLAAEYRLNATVAERLGRPAPRYRHLSGGWELLETAWCEGMSPADPAAPRVGLGQLLRAVIALNRRGIAHGDLHTGNVLLGPDGSVELIDYEHAVVTTPPRAFLSDVLGVGRPKEHQGSSFRSLLRHEMQGRRGVLPAVTRAVYVGRHRRSQAGRPRPMLGARPWLQQDIQGISELRMAWEHARASGDARTRLPSYGFELAGHVFRGVRAWETVWTHVTDHASLSGKQVLDITPEVGLAATFAAIEGAAQGIALLGAPHMVAASEGMASAFGVLQATQFREGTTDATDLPDADVMFRLDPRAPVSTEDLARALLRYPEAFVVVAPDQILELRTTLPARRFSHFHTLGPSRGSHHLLHVAHAEPSGGGR